MTFEQNLLKAEETDIGVLSEMWRIDEQRLMSIKYFLEGGDQSRPGRGYDGNVVGSPSAYTALCYVAFFAK